MNAISDILASKTDDFLPSVPDNHPLTDNRSTSVLNTSYTDRPQPIFERQNQKSEIHFDQLKSMLYALRDELDRIIRIVSGEQIQYHQTLTQGASELLDTGERVIEGVFNGEKMVGPDGQEYAIPPNYASKSKLVEGDIMKLTITRTGQFIYKQIGPIERTRLLGELISDPTTGQWSVLANGRTYKILTASATFYKGKAGDHVIFLVPKESQSSWGAVENIMH